jgi:hypothetical protein
VTDDEIIGHIQELRNELWVVKTHLLAHKIALSSVCDSHPHPAALYRSFDAATENAIANYLAHPYPDVLVDVLANDMNALRDVMRQRANAK